jgi:predicted PurR-regulated permease PerM
MADDSPRASDLPFLRRALILVAVGALVAAVWLLSDVLLLVFGSVLIAVTLRALAAPLSAHFGLGERWALAIVGVLLLSAVTAAVLLFGADLSVQMRGLSEQLSAVVKMLGERLQMDSLADLLKGENPATSIGAIVARLFAWSSTLLGVLAGLLLVLFGGIYLAVDPGLYRAGLVKLVPPAVQPNIEAALDDAGEALRRWLGAQAMAMVLVGTITGIGFWLIGLPSPLALGLIMGLSEFVPMVGPIIAAVPALLLAAGQGWQTALLGARHYRRRAAARAQRHYPSRRRSHPRGRTCRRPVRYRRHGGPVRAAGTLVRLPARPRPRRSGAPTLRGRYARRAGRDHGPPGETKLTPHRPREVHAGLTSH